MGSTQSLSRHRRETDDRVAAAVQQLHAAVVRRTGVSVPLRLWDATELGDEQAGFRIALRHPWSLRRMLTPPLDLAAGEAYVEGAIDLEGDPVAAMGLGAALEAGGLGAADRLA
ncbi:MAG: hypothetical protein ACRDU8_06205, partial [Egibacteraceae bacterium]